MNCASIVTGGVVGSRPNTLLPNTQQEIASNAFVTGIGAGGRMKTRGLSGPPSERYESRATPSPKSSRSVARVNVASAFRQSSVQPTVSTSAQSGERSSAVRPAHSIS